MDYAGFVSNGEYNVFRMKGFSRTLSVLRLRSEARTMFASISKSRMEKMLCPEGLI